MVKNRAKPSICKDKLKVSFFQIITASHSDFLCKTSIYFSRNLPGNRDEKREDFIVLPL